MSLTEHPDYQKEVKRLLFTRNYIESIIIATESSKENYREKITEAFEDLDWMDSSLNYTNILTNAQFLQRSAEEVRNLKKIRPKPYFARINFKHQDRQDEEILYIGKASVFDRETQEPIIVDWRSPIANVYYDGRLGQVEYLAEGETYEGYLSLKRQYEIEEGTLVSYRDVDLTTNDELLQDSLAKSSDNRLSEIVSTIQGEQNEIIRADLNRPIIVQGAAGSGKTTIALHRISYFIYTLGQEFDPEKMMVIAPNRLFIDYISEVLPELGVDQIRQTTYIDYVQQCVGKKIKVIPQEKKLVAMVQSDKETVEKIKWISEFKGSFQYQKMLDQYMNDVKSSFYPTADFSVEKFRLMTAKKLTYLFQREYHYLPYYRRLDRIKQVLQGDVRRKKKQMLHKVESIYEHKLDVALSIKNPLKRRITVSSCMDEKEVRLVQLNKEIRTAVTSFMKHYPKKTLFDYYQEFFQPENFLALSKGILSDEQALEFLDYQSQYLQKNTYEMEDLASLLYLQHYLYGVNPELKAKNIVIDEAQDYSYFQFSALKALLGTDMFTIVGDLAQGIHSYRGMTDWNELVTKVFPRANYKLLQKSYRTTVEIMEAANVILGLMPESIPKVEPVVRHGQKPLFIQVVDKLSMVESIVEKINEQLLENNKTFAIITKSERDAKALHVEFNKRGQVETSLLVGIETMETSKVVIVPSYIAKGLEFDSVFVVSVEDPFTETDVDIKLLYVAMTRPLHRLTLLAKEKKNLLINWIDNELIDNVV
ncbi:RNA polymerase recycling motor HelD [Bacillus pinisoli]|uniref:RNA polymerase recycling motor HelD n=1 Tax=Bacillus pinisoli TaxID=2901866 RepID=UPI001FF57C7C|nr:RNA polymerase recycling motor HelD [Bacillus pinisoli]